MRYASSRPLARLAPRPPGSVRGLLLTLWAARDYVLFANFRPDRALVRRLRAAADALGVPVPLVSAMLDLGAYGNPEALTRLVALADLSEGDSGLEDTLAAGLAEVGGHAGEALLRARSGAERWRRAAELSADDVARSAEGKEHPWVRALRLAAASPDPATRSFARRVLEAVEMRPAKRVATPVPD